VVIRRRALRRRIAVAGGRFPRRRIAIRAGAPPPRGAPAGAGFSLGGAVGIGRGLRGRGAIGGGCIGRFGCAGRRDIVAEEVRPREIARGVALAAVPRGRAQSENRDQHQL
jgi:hypothetical protein